MDLNRLCLDSDPICHVHSDPDPAPDPAPNLDRIRINTNPDLTNIFEIFLKIKALTVVKMICLVPTEVLLSTNFKFNIL